MTNKKLQFSTILILLTCFSQMLLSSNLWLSTNRDFPRISAFEFLPLHLNSVVIVVLLFLMIISFVLIIIFPDKRKFLLLFSVVALILVLEDIMRFQPWFYLHLVMVSLLAFEKNLTRQHLIRLLQFVVLAIYFWGGFNKLNLAFAWENFPWFMEPLGLGEHFFLGFGNLASFPLPALNYIAFLIPLVEICIALFFMIPRFRKIGLLLCVLTHLFSLFVIGPWGHNWNQVVWPWNVEMPILCFLLFYNPSEEFGINSYVQTLKSKTGIVILFLFLLAPVLSFFGKWDKELAIHLYSGNTRSMSFYFEGFQEKLVNTSIAPHISMDTITMTNYMKVQHWATAEIATPVYSETRYLKRIGAHLCQCLENTENSGIQIVNRSGFLSTQDTLRFSCDELR